jgi:arginine deiminase
MKETAVAHTLGVHSEVGQLRRAIVHRPGLELNRLTPDNREEHDTFAATLRERGVAVHHFDVLLGETLAIPQARAFILDRVCTPEQGRP